MTEKLVIIGNGLAGTRALEELIERAPGHYDIAVFGDEPYATYDRIQLSSVLAGTKTVEEVTLHDLRWYAERGIDPHCGTRVSRIDTEQKCLSTQCGQDLPYDRLLIATGSKPFMLPLPGVDLEGVIGFRDLGDVERMLATSKTHNRAVVIGGGLLGLEAAHGLLKRGMQVTVVHLMDTLMERQLDSAAGQLLLHALRQRRFEFRMETRSKAILGSDRVEGLRFESGEEIPADLIVMAVGIVPNKLLALSAGLTCNRGIVVDDVLRTSDPAIYALGECVEHAGRTYGLVSPLYEMARVWAGHMAGDSNGVYRGSTPGTGLKVAGIDLYSSGVIRETEDDEAIAMEDRRRGIYKKLVLRDDRVAGILLYGEIEDAHWYSTLMRDKTDVSGFRDDLIFGRSFFAGPDRKVPGPSTAELSDDAEICGCNGVCKGTIVSAIQTKALTTIEEVRSHTKASSSCGTCSSLVGELMEAVLGDRFDKQTGPTPICGCTHLDHDTVRESIRRLQLMSVEEVMLTLGWERPEGCARCRPALNFYLLCAWPGDYVDEGRDRFVNERVHGNIQQDGTFSVIPRIRAGLASPDELRAIADAADKYGIPEIKLTGGQRMGLYGVKKEDLPDVWADLGKAGLISGHAYGKALRTVKTCVGREWCRFGTQNSTGLGKRLDDLAWGSWMPHKFKMGVSGCPRNCAEATIKDFGVVCVESGYELHVGGNGGLHVRATDLLCHVKTGDEVLEYAGAFIQLYRESARYNTRTAPWIQEVGLDFLKDRLVGDSDGRAELFARFRASQQYSQKDPWKARVKDDDLKRAYQPLAVFGPTH